MGLAIRRTSILRADTMEVVAPRIRDEPYFLWISGIRNDGQRCYPILVHLCNSGGCASGFTSSIRAKSTSGSNGPLQNMWIWFERL